MKITFVLASNDFSGGCQVITNIARILSHRGHSVNMICPKKPLKSIKSFFRDFVRKGDMNLRRHQRGYADEMGKSLVYFRAQIPVYPDHVPEADVVIATWFETAHWVAALPSQAGGKLYFMQDYGAPHMPFDKLVPTWRYPFVFVTLTNALAAMIRSENEFAEISVMKNAVPDRLTRSACREKPEHPLIGFAYRSLPSKGMELAISSLKIAKSVCPELQAVCFGRHKPQNLPSFIEFVDCPTDEQRDKLYASCTAWLFPSLQEGFGLPIIEAMAAGTPVIATRAGAAPDIVISKFNGILLDDFQREHMSKAILSFVNEDPDQWRVISSQAMDSVLNYSWDDAVDIFESACLSAASQK